MDQLSGGRRCTYRQSIFQGGGLGLADQVVGDGRGEASPEASVEASTAAQALREVQSKSPGRHGGICCARKEGMGGGREIEWFDGFFFV